MQAPPYTHRPIPPMTWLWPSIGSFRKQSIPCPRPRRINSTPAPAHNRRSQSCGPGSRVQDSDLVNPSSKELLLIRWADWRECDSGAYLGDGRRWSATWIHPPPLGGRGRMLDGLGAPIAQGRRVVILQMGLAVRHLASHNFLFFCVFFGHNNLSVLQLGHAGTFFVH